MCHITRKLFLCCLATRFIVAIPYAHADDIETEYAYRVPLEGGWAFFDIFAIESLRIRAEWVSNVHEGMVLVGTGHRFQGFVGDRVRHVEPGTFRFYDIARKEYIGGTFSDALPFSDGLAPVAVKRSTILGFFGIDRWGYVDRGMNYVIEPAYSGAGRFSEMLAMVREDSGRCGYIDRRGTLAISYRFLVAEPFEGGKARVSEDGIHYWYSDKQGKKTIDCTLNGVSSFSEGMAVVSFRSDNDTLYGYMTSTGQCCITPQFSYALPFCNGLAAVRLESGGQMGYIDTRGAFVIQPIYSRCESFRNGLALVEMGASNQKSGLSESALINKEGTCLWRGSVDWGRLHMCYDKE